MWRANSRTLSVSVSLEAGQSNFLFRIVQVIRSRVSSSLIYMDCPLMLLRCVQHKGKQNVNSFDLRSCFFPSSSVRSDISWRPKSSIIFCIFSSPFQTTRRLQSGLLRHNEHPAGGVFTVLGQLSLRHQSFVWHHRHFWAHFVIFIFMKKSFTSCRRTSHDNVQRSDSSWYEE